MLNVNVSSKHESQLQQLAALKNEDIESLATRLLEEKIEQTVGENPNGKSDEAVEAPAKERKYMRMKGMFNSGRSDTSERMSELLKEEDFDPAEGFSIR